MSTRRKAIIGGVIVVFVLMALAMIINYENYKRAIEYDLRHQPH